MSGTVMPEVVVLGGSGAIGQGVVGALLEVGVPVLAVARDRRRLQALAERFDAEPGLQTLRGSLSDERSAQRLAADLRCRSRPLAAVIACLGGAINSGRLLAQPGQRLKQALRQNLMPHVHAADQLLPLLASAAAPGRYVLVGGPAAWMPWAGHGDRSVAAAALRMYAQVLHQEARQLGVRAQMLEVTHPVCTPANAAHACPEWPSALAVGRRVAALLRGNGCSEAIVRCDEPTMPPPQALLRTGCDDWPKLARSA